MPHVTQIVSETTDCNFGDALRSTRCEVVAIDTSLADWPILRDGVTASAEVVLIDGGGNGLAQLAKALDGRTGIDAIHLLSHGFAGGIQIGSERLDVTALVAQASSLIAIGESLSENAEILLYGCWTASGDGQSFLRVLAEITGAGVAASHDVIGAASLGGNWILDCRASGTVPRAILTSATMNAYQHTLAAPTVTLTNDNPGYLSGAGSGGLDLFSLVTAATNDGGQTFTGATFQVYGVTSNTEFLSIAGTDVQLTDGMSGPLTSGGYVVTVASGVATVTLSGMTLSDGQMSALIDGMSYKNTGGGGSSPGVTEARSVILRTVTDSGLPGDNATAVNQASTVTIDDGSTVNFVGTSTPASNVVAVASGSTTTVHFSIVQPAPLTLIGSMIQFNVVAPPGWIISSQALDGGPPSLSGFLLPGTHDFSFDITSTGTDTNGVFPITVLSLATGLDLSNAFNSSTILAVFPPTLTAIGGTPTIPQHSTSAVSLFSSVTANDSGGTFVGAVITVSGVADSAEYLTIGGIDVALTNGNSVALPGLGISGGDAGVSVAISGGIATLTISGLSLSESAMDGLVNGMNYRDSSSNTLSGSRTISITSVTDINNLTANLSGVSASVTVLDTTPPAAPVITSAALSDDATPVIAGTAEAGSTVTLTVAGATYTIVAIGGAWSINLGSAIPVSGALGLNANGNNGISAFATDPAGNISTLAVQTLTLDTLPPTAPVITSAALSDDATPVVAGTAEAGSTVTLTVAGAIYTAIAVGGAWSINLGSAIPASGALALNANGANGISAFATDPAGNISTLVVQTLTLDTLAPTAPVITSAALSDDATPVIAGTAEAGSIITVIVAGATYTTVATGGSWSIDLGSAIPASGALALNANGANGISAFATDPAGNISTSAVQTLTLDTLPPTAPVITSAALSDDATPVVAGTAEAGSTVTVIVSGATYTAVAIGGAWSIDLGSAVPVSGALALNTNGPNSISASAADTAGNISTSAAQTLTLDTTPPAAPAITSAALSDDATPVIAGTAEAGSTVTLTVAGAIYTTIAIGGVWGVNLGSAIPVAGALALNANGNNAISAFATDPAGNISTLEVQTLALDTLPPTAPIITSAALSDDATPDVAGTAEAGDTVTVIVSGATYTTVAIGGAWSIDLGLAIPASGALVLNANGVNGVSAFATDAAGNISTLAVQTLILDTTSPTAPVITSTALSDDAAPVVTGTAEAGSTVTLAVAGAIYTTIATSGAWSVDLGSAVPVSGVLTLDANGDNGISAFVTDPAGNVSTLTDQTLTLDITPPAAPVITSAALTDDAAPVVAGTAEAGSTVTLTVAGAIYTTIAIGGAWSVDLGSAIPASGALALNANGVNGVSAFATDPAGNISTLAVQTLILDTTSPTAPVITSTALSDDAAPVVAGTAEAGSTVTLTVAGAVYTTIAIGGGWSVDLGSAVPASGALALNANGNNGISAFVTDPAGNISPSAAQTLTLDTTPPTAPVITSAALSDDVAPVVAGTAEPGSIVTLTVAGATYTTIAIGGAWSVDLGTAVPVSGVLTLDANGDNGISASATDPAGNVSTLAVQTLTLDTTSPTAPVITSAALSDDAAPVVAGTAEPGSTVTLTVAGATYTTVAIGGAWSVDLGSSVPVSGALSLDANGDNSVLAIASDPAGNVSTPTTQTLSLDTTAPVVTDLAASGSGITAGSGDLTIGAVIVLTLTLSEAVTVDTGNGTPTLTLNDGGVATYAAGSGTNTLAFTYTVGAGQTASDLAVTAFNLNLATVQDGAGNDADASGAIGNPPGILQIDTTVPTVIGLEASGSGVIAGAGDLTIGAAVVLTLTLSEAVTIAGSGTPTLTLNDGGVATYASGSGTNTLTFTYTVEGGQTASDLAVTAFNLNSSTVQDGRGNDADTSGAIVSPTGTLQIDTTAPSVTGVTVAGTSITAGDGDLTTGAMVAVTLIMSEAVAVAGGTPTLTLNDGGVATYASGSGTNTLTFTYTVGSGQTASDLAVTAFNLNSATVQDGASNNADTAGAIVNPPGTLQIDTTAPIVTAALVDNPRNAGGIVYSQILSGGGDPNTTVTISEGGQTVGTAQADGTGAWSFDPSSLSPSTHTLVASETDAAGNIGSTGEEPVTVPDARFDLTNEANTVSGSLVGSDYTGPVSYLQAQYIYTGSDNVILGARVPNVFIHGGSGDDALAVSAGSNVLDGGGGSNWLVGASGADGGNDTFFVDGRSGQPTWDTLVNFHPGDFLTFWGYNSTSGSIGWADNQGAPGYQGATLVANLGNGSAGPSLVTFAGLSVGSAQFATITGSSGGTDFLLVARLA